MLTCLRNVHVPQSILKTIISNALTGWHGKDAMGMDDDNVAIQCHKDHEEDATVQAQHEETCYGMTHEFAKNPLVHGTVSPKRE